MDTQRLLLFIAFSVTVMFLWQAWQTDYGPQPPQQSAVAAAPTATPVPGGDVPSAPVTPGAGTPAVAPVSLESGTKINVTTDLFQVEIDTRGGAVTSLKLRKYPIELGGSDAFRLMGTEADLFYLAQSGLLGAAERAPDHHALYTSAANSYALAEGSDELRVPLVWKGADGVSVTKTYIFNRDSYAVRVEQTVQNGATEEWRGRAYRQLQRTLPSEGGGNRFMYTYTGGAIYSPEDKYQKIKFDEMAKKPLNREISDGWAAMLQHYFVSAWIPAREEANHYYSKVIDGSRYVIGMVTPETAVAPGASHTFNATLFAGPKLQGRMEKVAPGLNLTVDYGILTFIAQPIFWLMTHIHNVLGNWGWTIIVLTLMIKGALYKLSETSYRSMANMRKLQPRLAKLKELYGDDRAKLNEKMMEIYKEEKINPLGGCLPIVMQIPIFIALYWVLLESVEMRHAPWILWIHDLSAMDPYYVLPVLMGITMFIQQKLNPQPVDPIQAKVMMALPVVFTFFFAFFPSGLVVYWVVNSVASIAQQWVITKRIEGGK